MYPRKYVIHMHTQTPIIPLFIFRTESHCECRRQHTDHTHKGSFGLRPVDKDKNVKLHIKYRLSNVHVINITQTEIISNALDKL